MEKRIYQLLKQSGAITSNEEAQALLDAERVKVNGVSVHSLKYKVNTKFQQVTVDNKPIYPVEQSLYILLNKPRGYSCQPHEKKTYVLDLIHIEERLKKTLFLVGRLDHDTEGALLITNDGKLAHHMLTQKIQKTYEALVKGEVLPEEIEKLQRGVVIPVEIERRLSKYRTKPAKVKVLQKKAGTTLLEIIVTEGKKRQIRKMCDAVGHKVLALTRTMIGTIALGGLEQGEYRFLKKSEIECFGKYSKSINFWNILIWIC